MMALLEPVDISVLLLDKHARIQITPKKKDKSSRKYRLYKQRHAAGIVYKMDNEDSVAKRRMTIDRSGFDLGQSMAVAARRGTLKQRVKEEVKEEYTERVNDYSGVISLNDLEGME